jgi:hypothetical protein
MTPKEANLARQHAFRNRRLAMGLDEVRGIWLPKELHQELKRIAEELKANGRPRQP